MKTPIKPTKPKKPTKPLEFITKPIEVECDADSLEGDNLDFRVRSIFCIDTDVELDFKKIKVVNIYTESFYGDTYSRMTMQYDCGSRANPTYQKQYDAYISKMEKYSSKLNEYHQKMRVYKLELENYEKFIQNQEIEYAREVLKKHGQL